ncbi:MAG: hybrid sensor histidine kinase/response regulator [bacterium]|nr:hybrid sensor histidine kinase/response regulator [bacterium]
MGNPIILIVDDDPQILKVLGRTLAADGYEIITAAGPDEAVARFDGTPIFLIITDYTMNGANGVELLEKIKAISPDTVRMVMSGNQDFGIVEQAVNRGRVDKFIIKPWENADLRSSVRGAWKNYELVSHNRELLRLIEEKNLSLKEINARLEESVEERTLDFRLANQRLEIAVGFQKELLNIISHEVRTPVNAISGYISLLRENAFGEISEEVGQVLGKMDINTNEIGEMLDYLLHSSRLEQGKIEKSDLAEINLKSLIQEVLPLVQPLAQLKGLGIEIKYNEKTPLITTDPNRVKYILINLLSNAVKYTRKGGIEILAAPSLDSSGVVAAVSDTGIGIAEKELPLIFNKFYRVDNQAEQAEKGLGLGLAIVKDYVRLLNGRISVESRPGAGSTFTVELPVDFIFSSAENRAENTGDLPSRSPAPPLN